MNEQTPADEIAEKVGEMLGHGPEPEIARVALAARREVEELRPWCFIAEGDERQINYAAHEDHDYAVLIGDNHWWCAGCLSKPPRRFTEDGYSMWPNLVAAPNGLRLVIEPVVDGMNVARRPLCPRSLAGEVRSDD